MATAQNTTTSTSMGASSPQSLEEKKAIARRYSEGDVDDWQEVCAPDVTVTMAGWPTLHGLDELSKFAIAARSRIEGSRKGSIAVQEMIAEGDAVVTRWTAHVTPKETFTMAGATFPAGKVISNDGLSIIRLRDGKVVEEFTRHSGYSVAGE